MLNFGGVCPFFWPAGIGLGVCSSSVSWNNLWDMGQSTSPRGLHPEKSPNLPATPLVHCRKDVGGFILNCQGLDGMLPYLGKLSKFSELKAVLWEFPLINCVTIDNWSRNMGLWYEPQWLKRLIWTFKPCSGYVCSLTCSSHIQTLKLECPLGLYGQEAWQLQTNIRCKRLHVEPYLHVHPNICNIETYR